MSRPKKCKRVCMMPRASSFSSSDLKMGEQEPLVMSVEEYETIRLIDYEGLSQEECAEQMSVGRATIQRIYSDARKKLAQFLLEERTLKVEGGDFEICDGDQDYSGCCECPKQISRKI
jgi:predicted DNA-binding protein (UPF0251 family)